MTQLLAVFRIPSTMVKDVPDGLATFAEIPFDEEGNIGDARPFAAGPESSFNELLDCDMALAHQTDEGSVTFAQGGFAGTDGKPIIVHELDNDRLIQCIAELWLQFLDHEAAEEDALLAPAAGTVLH
jgi:hypothetical protein